jgi:hypothetical protein
MLERESQKNNKLLFDVAHKIYELEIKKNKLIISLRFSVN